MWIRLSKIGTGLGRVLAIVVTWVGQVARVASFRSRRLTARPILPMSAPLNRPPPPPWTPPR
jgi:hypothetical protein